MIELGAIPTNWTTQFNVNSVTALIILLAGALAIVPKLLKNSLEWRNRNTLVSVVVLILVALYFLSGALPLGLLKGLNLGTFAYTITSLSLNLIVLALLVIALVWLAFNGSLISGIVLFVLFLWWGFSIEGFGWSTITSIFTSPTGGSLLSTMIPLAGAISAVLSIQCSFDTYDKLLQQGKFKESDIVKVSQSFAIPEGPIAVRKDMNQSDKADLRLAVSGITTEFHAVSLDDDEFSVRSDAFVRELCEAIKETAAARLIRYKVHARLELSSQRGYAAIMEMMVQGCFDLISLMDHSPGQGQYRTEAAYRDYIVRTTGKSHEEINAFLLVKKAQTQVIPDRIKGIAHRAQQLGLAIATHDDDTAVKVEQWPALGVNICEFPTTLEAARRAHDLALAVCMGAPNVLRGKSSGGNLSALAAINAGVTDVLCSDYYPAAMLNAVFALVRQHILSLLEAVRLVTLNPARAVGLDTTIGSLEVGKVADLILVKPGLHNVVSVERVFVSGKEVLRRSAL